MTTLKLENKYDAFHLLLAVHLTLIATEVVLLYLQWNCSTNYSSYISKACILSMSLVYHSSLPQLSEIDNILRKI